jgi:serine protease AprX
MKRAYSKQPTARSSFAAAVRVGGFSFFIFYRQKALQMAIVIPRALAEYILLGPTGDRRQLQDSPILGDVWIAFAGSADAQELLITPHKSKTAGTVAKWIDEEVWQDRKAHQTTSRVSPEVAYLQGVVAARMHFDEVLRIIVPTTSWWSNPRVQGDVKIYSDAIKGRERIRSVLTIVQKMAAHWSETSSTRPSIMLSALDRYGALAGIILWANRPETQLKQDATPADLAAAINASLDEIANGLTDLFLEILDRAKRKRDWEGSLVYQISLNRHAELAIERSVPSVKADAAARLFQVNCQNITWAVIDAGVQGDHPAFGDGNGHSRVIKSFDFSYYRKIVNLDNLRIFDKEGDESRQQEVLSTLLNKSRGLKSAPSKKRAAAFLRRLAEDAKDKRPIHWELVEPFIEIEVATRPVVSDHGTHVAGIIGAKFDRDARQGTDGMCPDIRLYDFRVLTETNTAKDTEFAIIAALQYIRHLNERNDYMSVHGANLSLSIKHDVRNYACGRTPICDECETLVESGVVVVAAAGNFGYQSFTTKEGAFENYAAFSITDPGNADGVITVGSTHRYLPHTYGVSFFSSRGPTGDGRLKPDLVAPGERISAPFREGWGELDGTSMAAPHVSGAAAMLMARYPEFIRQPRKIKKILCETATDLGRERSFQGNGLLDVLRAFQSI